MGDTPTLNKPVTLADSLSPIDSPTSVSDAPQPTKTKINAGIPNAVFMRVV
jgi:hypothetical protein